MPNNSVRLVCDPATARRMPRWGVLELLVEALHVGEQFGGQVMAGSVDRRDWSNALEESDGIGSVEFLGDSAW
jgi:hypothetical protein